MDHTAKNRSIRRSIKAWAPLFVLPSFVCFFVSFVSPFIQGIYLSFCNFNIPKDAKWVGIENYTAAFSDPGFGTAFLNTFLFAAASIIAINIPAFFAAFFLSEKFRGVKLFRTAFFVPNLIGGVVLGYIWSMLFDGILRYFGTYLTASPAYGFWGLVILVAWQQIGYMMIIYIAGFQSIPADMLEAADIDGASPAQKLFGITLPNMISSISICVFLTLTNGFKMFDQNLALTGGAPIKTLENGMQLKTTELLALNIYSTYNINRNWHGTAQAKAVVFFLIVGAFSLLQQYLTNRDSSKVSRKKAGADQR
ncbi:MAG: sugar ABC transporter permease [Oscillospiraceae bacterium]|nr:sugar ABC transporter permease [Oscillospiraceae bacterium]